MCLRINYSNPLKIRVIDKKSKSRALRVPSMRYSHNNMNGATGEDVTDDNVSEEFRKEI